MNCSPMTIAPKRSKRQSDFEGSATYGYCASRKLNYFGYKLVMVTTLSGLPLVYDLVPANTDERAAAETVLVDIQGCTILADKGFIGVDWQADVGRVTENRIFTPILILHSYLLNMNLDLCYAHSPLT